MIELPRILNPKGSKSESKCGSRILLFFQGDYIRGIGGIVKDSYAGNFRKNFLKKFESFRG